MTKKTGMRKPWMAETTTPNAASCRLSATTHRDGKNERAACRTIPSSMETARRASRSDRRSGGGLWVLMQGVRPASPDIEGGRPGRTVEGQWRVAGPIEPVASRGQGPPVVCRPGHGPGGVSAERSGSIGPSLAIRRIVRLGPEPLIQGLDDLLGD